METGFILIDPEYRTKKKTVVNCEDDPCQQCLIEFRNQWLVKVMPTGKLIIMLGIESNMKDDLDTMYDNLTGTSSPVAMSAAWLGWTKEDIVAKFPQYGGEDELTIPTVFGAGL